jgi:hypothetical protein
VFGKEGPGDHSPGLSRWGRYLGTMRKRLERLAVNCGAFVLGVFFFGVVWAILDAESLWWALCYIRDAF